MMKKGLNLSTFFSKRLSKASQNDDLIKISFNIGIFTIAIGIALLLVGFFVIDGFFESLDNRIKNFAGDLTIYKGGLGEKEELFGEEEAQKILKSLNRQEFECRKIVSFPVICTAKKQNYGMIITGTSDLCLSIGDYIIEGDLSESPKNNQIVISSFWKEKLNLKIGDSILICTFSKMPRYKKMQVCAVYKTDLPDFDERFAILDLHSSYFLNKEFKGLVQFIKINLKNQGNIEESICNIKKILPKDFHVKDSRNELSDIYEWIDVLRQNVYLFMVILLIVILSVMMGIYSVLFVNKLFTIDLMKAIGVKFEDISLVFFKMAQKMIVKGLLLGNLFVGIIIFLMKFVLKVKLDASVHYVEHVPIKFSFKFFSIVNFSIIVVSILSWILSAFFIRYMKIDTSKYR